MIIGHGASWERIDVVSKDRLAPLNWVIMRLNMALSLPSVAPFSFSFHTHMFLTHMLSHSRDSHQSPENANVTNLEEVWVKQASILYKAIRFRNFIITTQNRTAQHGFSMSVDRKRKENPHLMSTYYVLGLLQI